MLVIANVKLIIAHKRGGNILVMEIKREENSAYRSARDVEEG